MAADSTRKQILQVILDRLALITRPSGFVTDAGQSVIVGEIAIGPDDVDAAIAVVPGETGPLSERQLMKTAETLPIQIAALARVLSWQDYAHAWMRAEDVLSDIKAAVEQDDRTLGGLAIDITRGPVLPLERGEGQTTIGCAVTYDVTYATAWGAR
jgi:hypothetical protein